MKFYTFKEKEPLPFVTLDITRLDGGEKNEHYYMRLLASALRDKLKVDIKWTDEYGNMGGVGVIERE